MKTYLWEITVLPSADLSFAEAINRELKSKYVYQLGTIKEIQTYCKQNYQDKVFTVKPIEEIQN